MGFDEDFNPRQGLIEKVLRDLQNPNVERQEGRQNVISEVESPVTARSENECSVRFENMMSEKKEGEAGVEKFRPRVDADADLKQELRRDPGVSGWSFNIKPVKTVDSVKRLTPISDDSVEISSESSSYDIFRLEKMVLDLSDRLDKQTRLTESLELTVKSLQLKVETLSTETPKFTPDPKPICESPDGQGLFLAHHVGPMPKHYNSKSYLDLERGKFQKGITLQDAISKSLHELINKPLKEKEPMEQRLDELYTQYLPKKFLEFTSDVPIPGTTGTPSDSEGSMRADKFQAQFNLESKTHLQMPVGVTCMELDGPHKIPSEVVHNNQGWESSENYQSGPTKLSPQLINIKDYDKNLIVSSPKFKD